MSQQLVDSLNKQVEQHLHGKAREGILAQLEQAPTPDTMAQIVYELMSLMAQQAEGRGAGLEIEVLMGVATEAIDILIEILEAMGQAGNPDELREETLIKVLLIHMAEVENDPEEKAAAQELLAEITGDGTLQSTMDHINSKAGASPEQMQQAGAAMVQPQQKPLAAGVQRGLMQ